MDSRLTRRLTPRLKSVAQERAHSPARLRHPPAKARGGVFFEADFHGLTERGFQRLAVAGFVNLRTGNAFCSIAAASPKPRWRKLKLRSSRFRGLEFSSPLGANQSRGVTAGHCRRRQSSASLDPSARHAELPAQRAKRRVHHHRANSCHETRQFPAFEASLATCAPPAGALEHARYVFFRWWAQQLG